MSRQLRFLLLVFMSFAVNNASATFVGDLVYCDVNNDGEYNVGDGDFGLNDVQVTMTCRSDSGQVCFSDTTTTGPDVFNTPDIGLLEGFCAEAPLTWNPAGGASEAEGRYLFEIASACGDDDRPAACSIEVTGGLPDNCNVLGTPRVTSMGGMPARPVDNNNDGDFCDTVDGPFPESQPLGNTGPYGGCEARPDPAPGDNLYTVIIGPGGDECSIYNDFGFKPPAPAIDIEKATNGVDADDPNAGDAPQVEPGDPVFWTYVVTNTGPVTLFNVSVSDDQGVAVSCPTDTLAPGGMMTCTAAGTAEELINTGFTTVPGFCGNIPDRPLYENMGRATGESAQGEFVQDEDPSHYCNPPGPDIDIEKATNGVDADDPNAGDAPQIEPGDPVTWSYLVTNIGDVPLQNVIVDDDQIGPVTCPQTTLLVDESMTCTANGVAEDLNNTMFATVPGLCGARPQRPLYENMGRATGQTVAGDVVEDIDPSHYCNPPPPPDCGLTVVKGCEIPPPPPPSGKCEGRLTQLTMIWDGADGTPVNGPGFNGVVNNGDEVIFQGPFSETDVDVAVGDGMSTFHTSCSDKDLDGDTDTNEDQQQVSSFGRDCGKFQGDRGGSEVNQWLLEGFIDKNGDVLDCTVSTDGPLVSNCEFFSEPVSCETFKPDNLTWQYTGGGCGASNNSQDSGDLFCTGSVDGSEAVTIVDDGGNVFNVEPGGSFTTSRGDSKVFTLSNAGGTEQNGRHVSCSQPLGAGDVYGSLTLSKLDDQGLGADVIYSYLISNNGTETISNITAIDNVLGPVPGSPLALLVPGDSATLSATAFVTETVTNTVDVEGSVPSGAECTATASTTVTSLGPPPCSIGIELYSVEDDKLKIELTNNGSSTVTMDGLAVSYPAARGVIEKVKLNGDAYKFNDSSAPVTDNPAFFGPADWTEEDVSKRQIKPGDTKKLEIETFDTSSKEDRFEVAVDFGDGCLLFIVVENQQIVN